MKAFVGKRKCVMTIIKRKHPLSKCTSICTGYKWLCDNCVRNNATCYECALHASHKGGFCRSRDVKHPCSQIEYNYIPKSK